MRFSHLALVVCMDFGMAFFILGYGQLKQYDQELTHTILMQWVESGIRWVILYGLSSLYQDDIHLLRRWVTAHCVLGPVFCTGRIILLGNYPLDKSWLWFLNFLATTFACLFWELILPDQNGDTNGENTKTARVNLMRVILLYKPDYALAVGAFVFLSVAALCKYGSLIYIAYTIAFIYTWVKPMLQTLITCFPPCILHDV